MHLLTTTLQIFILFNYKLNAFEVGIRRTTCSLSSEDYNDPCGSLYNAICDGKHCKCPLGTHESKTLKNCQRGSSPKSSGSGGDDLFDLPFDYVPEKDRKPTTPTPDGTASGAKAPTNTNWNVFSALPQQSGGYPQQPAYNPSYPNQPDGYPYQPGGYPAQPSNEDSGGDSQIGEKAGGGVGGGIGLIILIGLIYFCCFRGKGKEQLMNILSKFRGGGERAADQPMPGQNGGGYAGGGYAGGGGFPPPPAYPGGGGYPMNQVHGQQVNTSNSKPNALYVVPTKEGGK